MKFAIKFIVFAALCAPLFAQATGNTTIQPDCLIPFTFTAAGNFPATNVTGGAGDNRTKGCAAWTLMYQSTGMTSVSVTLQSGSSVSTTVSYGSFAGTISTGYVNPIVSDTGGSLQATNGTADISWVRVHVAATGTGTLTGVLYGFRNSSAAVNGGGGSSNCPAGATGEIQARVSAGVCGGAATTVSALPSAAANTSTIFLVSDGATTSDCTSGMGMSYVLCNSNGAAWVALSGGASPAGSAGSVQLSNVATFACDPNFTVDTINHVFNFGSVGTGNIALFNDPTFPAGPPFGSMSELSFGNGGMYLSGYVQQNVNETASLEFDAGINGVGAITNHQVGFLFTVERYDAMGNPNAMNDGEVAFAFCQDFAINGGQPCVTMVSGGTAGQSGGYFTDGLRLGVNINAPAAALHVVALHTTDTTAKLQGDTALTLVAPKTTQAASAPGAGFADLRWLAGTNAGTCKLVSNAGTSATEVTIIDNVGGGC